MLKYSSVSKLFVQLVAALTVNGRKTDYITQVTERHMTGQRVLPLFHLGWTAG